MPKAFLLTNKRYKIWKKIKETFQEQQQRRKQQAEELKIDHWDHSEKRPYHNKKNLHVDDTSPDYSKYTDTYCDEECTTPSVRTPSPAVNPFSSITSSSLSSVTSDDSDSSYSYTTENRSSSPVIEFKLGCSQQHISFLYELMIGTNPTAHSDKGNTIAYYDHSLYKLGPEYSHMGHVSAPFQTFASQSQPEHIPIEASAEGTENHVCIECGKRYSTSSNLARHRQTHRTTLDKKARKCPHCDKMYVSMPAYSMHVRTHNQGCECEFCGKKFSRPWLLQGHIRTHTGEKPFSCSQCGKCFADKSNLRAHIQTHSADKPFVCNRCGKAFALKSYLYKHEESSCMRGQRFKH